MKIVIEITMTKTIIIVLVVRATTNTRLDEGVVELRVGVAQLLAAAEELEPLRQPCACWK